MRPLAAVLALLLLPAGFPAQAQEEAKIRELLLKLDDDSIDVRADAARALVAMGKGALPGLKKAGADARGELRERIAEIVRKINDREKLAALLPPATRVSLKAERMPLKEAFEKLSKQAATPIDFAEVPADATVTVSLDQVPFWKAIEQVCRSSGKVMADAEADRVVVRSEPFVELPGKLTDLFSVKLQRVDLSSDGTFGQAERFERFTATFHVTWEKGAKPHRVFAKLAELVDEKGMEVVAEGDDLDPVMIASIPPDAIRQEFALSTPDRGPGPQARRVAKLKVDVELEFPLKFAEVKFNIAGGKVPVAAECPEFSARVQRCDRSQGPLTADLVISPKNGSETDLAYDSIFLYDKEGKTVYNGVAMQSSATNEEFFYQVTFPTAPEGATFSEIRIRVPTEVHREKMSVEVKDLPLE